MTEIIEVYKNAKKVEAWARKLTGNETDFIFSSDALFEEEPYRGFPQNEACRDHDAKLLFEKAWALYHEVEILARQQVNQIDSQEGIALLAQILLDIHIHPNSGLKRDTPALWESQYLWLKLYYQTQEEAYLEKAKLCEGIRNARVEEIL